MRDRHIKFHHLFRDVLRLAESDPNAQFCIVEPTRLRRKIPCSIKINTFNVQLKHNYRIDRSSFVTFCFKPLWKSRYAYMNRLLRYAKSVLMPFVSPVLESRHKVRISTDRPKFQNRYTIWIKKNERFEIYINTSYTLRSPRLQLVTFFHTHRNRPHTFPE